MAESYFDIPVALFLFRRSDTIKRIIERLREVRVKKIYLLSDQGRTDEERKQVEITRKTAEVLIDWDCEIIKNYAEENRGVYGNIGLGAKWVFEQESEAIFLEDDNLPDVSFFGYCKQMLEKYRANDDIIWICGTNYLGEYRNKTKDSYMFTRNLLPCGWASWADKFLKYYDFDFASIKNSEEIGKNIRGSYITKALYRQEVQSITTEFMRPYKGDRYHSWDFHMIYSIRKNRLLGISPATNLIENIGVDAISEHGGNNSSDIMTKRFCGVKTITLETDMNHPTQVAIDNNYEKKVEKIITRPFRNKVSTYIARILRKVFKIPSGVKTKEFILGKH